MPRFRESSFADCIAIFYATRGGNFNVDEARYRLGLEAALHPDCRGKSCEDIMGHLNKKYGEHSGHAAFREGYGRGQHYLASVAETREDKRQDKQDLGKAA